MQEILDLIVFEHIMMTEEFGDDATYFDRLSTSHKRGLDTELPYYKKVDTNFLNWEKGKAGSGLN